MSRPGPRLSRRHLLVGSAGIGAGLALATGAVPAMASPAPTFTELGPAVTSTSGFSNGMLIGRKLWLVTSRMQPARAVAYDIDAQRVTDVVELPGVAGTWGADHVGTDLYIATYTPAKLIRLDTTSNTITDTVDLAESVAWNVKASPDGHVFAGTYPTAELWEYDPTTRTATNHGTMLAGQTYVRDLAASETTVYCGIGSQPGLIAFDRVTGSTTDIMPPEFADLSFVSTLQLSGDVLLAGTTPRANVAMINTADPSDYSIAPIPNDEPYVVSLYGKGDDVWVGTTKSNTIWHTTVGSTTVTPVTTGTTGTMRMGHLDDTRLWTVQAESAGLLDLTSGELDPFDLSSELLPPAPQKPQALHWADGRVFAPGTGVLAIHADDASAPVRNISTKGEVKDMDSAGGTVYAGLYTLALLGELPSDDTDSTALPVVSRLAASDEQTRPLDVAVDVDANRLLIGTEPDYGRWEGAFSWMDLTSKQVTTFRGILPDQSVSAVCPAPHGAWLGGSVRNGYGTTPTRDAAQLAFFDYRSNTLTQVVEPLADLYAIVDLRRRGNLLLALTNAGVLCGLDARTARLLWTVKVGSSGGRTTWLGSRLVGTDGKQVWSVRVVAHRKPSVEVIHTGLAAQWYGLPTVTSDGVASLFTVRGLDLIRLDLA
ncbi:hypothetical protein ACQBAU_12375 [Propionibacteriaceae bacterium Y2011]|uniref:hypothetical protein n=1 Tax=Microlunatus sp. Y2014 TaxID=3418488 RepID=UPI003B4DEB4B